MPERGALTVTAESPLRTNWKTIAAIVLATAFLVSDRLTALARVTKLEERQSLIESVVVPFIHDWYDESGKRPPRSLTTAMIQLKQETEK